METKITITKEEELKLLEKLNKSGTQSINIVEEEPHKRRSMKKKKKKKSHV